MGLKPDRRVVHDNQIFFMNHVADRGGLVCVSTHGSGAALDQSASLVHYVSSPSGVTPVGVLLQDMVNDDLTQVKQNVHKDEVQLGGKVNVMFRGEIVTNLIHSGVTVSAGDQAYLYLQGQFTNNQLTLGATRSPVVGKFLSGKDEDGYARISVNL